MMRALKPLTLLLIPVAVLLSLTLSAGFTPAEAAESAAPVEAAAPAAAEAAKSAEAAESVGEFVVGMGEENPVFYSNELFLAYEDFYSPRVKRLRERYGLDAVVAGETGEFRRIMLLRHWIHSTMRIDDYDYTSTRMEPFAILDAARAGGKFNCSHFSVVQHAVLNSFGYITRCLGTGPGSAAQEGLDGHHAVNEVWVNELNKWVLVDAKYDLHFEKHGIPLSGLEIRDEVWRNEASDVVPAFGLDGKPAVPQINDRDWGIWATPQVYRWCSWETSTNRFTSFPAALSSSLIMYEDDIFKRHIWYRDGRPHWAYDTPYLIKTTQRDWIYWTPNVISSQTEIQQAEIQDNGELISSQAEIQDKGDLISSQAETQDKGDLISSQAEIQDKGDLAHVFLLSFTPNFKTFQMKTGQGDWRDCDESLELPLQRQLNRFVFRTVNLFGVTGPEHSLEIDWKLTGN